MLQQGLQSGFITTTPPTDTLGANRFQTKAFGAVPSFLAARAKETLDNLPQSMKLLSIPTFILLIPRVEGGVGATLDADVAATMELLYDVSGGCPGVDFKFNSNAQMNQIVAEGEAEYFMAKEYFDSATAAWPTTPSKYNASEDWDQRIRDNTNNFLVPLRSEFHVKSGTGEETSRLEKLGFEENPIGELAFAYLKGTWRSQTTHADLLKVWEKSATMGFGPAFEEVIGKKWSTFVCDMEGFYNVNAGGQPCVEDDSWNVGLRSTADGGGGAGGLEAIDVVLPVLIVGAVGALLLFAYLSFAADLNGKTGGDLDMPASDV